MSFQNASLGRWAVAACFFVNGFMVGSWAPQIPVVASRFELSETALGLLILVFGCGAVSVMPLCGYLIGRLGSRRVLRVAAVVCALSFAGLVAATQIWQMVAALLFFGAFLGAMDISMNANAVAVERSLGRAVMSSSHGFWSLGGFVGAGLGGVLLERYGYMAHAGMVVAFAFVIALAMLPFLIVEARPVAGQAGGARAGFPRNPMVYVTGLVALTCMLPEGAVLDWAALYLRQEMGAGIAEASLAFTAFSGTMAVMRFAGDRLRNRFGAVRTLRYSGIVATIGMLGAGLAPTPSLAIIAFALSGMGIANMVPIVFSAAGNQPGLSPGAGMSVATTIGYSGMLVAPSLVGFIAERTGFAPIFLAFSVLLALVLSMAGLVRSADTIAAHP
ncbi:MULTISPECIES: MFS transporter [Nitratireductor]|uniref:MFS transporter n=1 Tax=Nitratireductor TaxID=245876 RepID=UPI0019D325E3|nr:MULTISPECIES: MFS transporter [Nitratireductor]MBN7777882.1 MFS transporter [Nitratireductor pacificus]MBN7782204.1 MFS transporter [Nitratireductor pacificus]MBN7791011.1 MFS transporter [Nitratireductor aquimarinus]MBY6100092.1 MFS transporter [Nitratireductor aquimarinus]MCV0352683.1 MFS transporter [Nitratireductor sp.]